MASIFHSGIAEPTDAVADRIGSGSVTSVSSDTLSTPGWAASASTTVTGIREAMPLMIQSSTGGPAEVSSSTFESDVKQASDLFCRALMMPSRRACRFGA